MWEIRSDKSKLIAHNIETHARPANGKSLEIIVSRGVKLVYARLPYLSRGRGNRGLR
uniref:Uncharacterized protein n=1 Tax=Arundo donax TaxID=35708 RepID=A0A0A8YMC4_ARUDO